MPSIVVGFVVALAACGGLDAIPADLREATGALSRLRDQRAAAVAAKESEAELAAIDLEIGAARNGLQVQAAALGNLSKGHLRSVWDLKSMLKAMDELHTAEVRRAPAAIVRSRRVEGGANRHSANKGLTHVFSCRRVVESGKLLHPWQ